MYIYIYIYRERERERDRQKATKIAAKYMQDKKMCFY